MQPTSSWASHRTGNARAPLITNKIGGETKSTIGCLQLGENRPTLQSCDALVQQPVRMCLAERRARGRSQGDDGLPLCDISGTEFPGFHDQLDGDRRAEKERDTF